MNTRPDPATDASAAQESPTHRYLEPGAITRRLFNPLMAGLVKLGIGVKGARILEVKGRVSGEWRSVPVNPLTLGEHRYLVAPRGRTQWVRNLRHAGGGRLRTGRRVEEFVATELADADKPEVVRAYLEEWAWEVGAFFEGITKDSSDAELLDVVDGFPVFEITPT